MASGGNPERRPQSRVIWIGHSAALAVVFTGVVALPLTFNATQLIEQRAAHASRYAFQKTAVLRDTEWAEGRRGWYGAR